MNGVYDKRSYARVRLNGTSRITYTTYHLASRQSNGRGHDEMCIFQQYGQVSEGQQRRRRQDVLRRLQRELRRKHTVVVCLVPIPRSGCMKAIRSGAIQQYNQSLSSARRWVNGLEGRNGLGTSSDTPRCPAQLDPSDS